MIRIFKSTFLLLVLSLLVGGCAPPKTSSSDSSETGTEAQTGGSEDRSGPMSGRSLDNWKNVFAEMTDVLQLDPAQQERLKSTFEEHVTRLKAWYEQHGATIARADRQAIQAARNRDLATIRKLKEEVTPRREEVARMHQEMDRAIDMALDEDKRFRWQGHRLAARLFELCEDFEWSEGQKERITELAVEAAKRVQSTPNPQAAGFIELEKRVEREVFNQQQRTEYQEIKDANKLRTLREYSSYQSTDRSDSKHEE